MTMYKLLALTAVLALAGCATTTGSAIGGGSSAFWVGVGRMTGLV